ncbi:MAG TPA: aldose epimerase family protein [Magnetospirillaceae bacterium]|jgi:aldose 1-epimerase
MSIRPFGQTSEGTPVSEAHLTLPSGMEASVIGFGSILRDLLIPVPGGGKQRVVLGYPDLAGYLGDAAHLGANAGRCANRIANGRFTLDGKTVQLALNEAGRTHLHGGPTGFGRRVWTIEKADDTSATLALRSPSGEGGYPGTVEARIIYRLLPPATLQIEFSATTDAPTIVNIAHHSYFTLNHGKSVRDHKLQVNGSRYTPTDAALIPSGNIASVEGTPYDFRTARPLSDTRTAPDFFYDMNLVLDRSGSGVIHAATVTAPNSPIKMEVHTTEPGLQMYDSIHLGVVTPGHDGINYGKHMGLCLEAQKFPDAPNHPNFPSVVLRPGETYHQTTEYRFPPA